MVVPVSAQISKLRSCLPHRAVLPCHSRSLPTTHSPLSSRRPVICITWRQYLSRSQQLPHTSLRHGGVPDDRLSDAPFASRSDLWTLSGSRRSLPVPKMPLRGSGMPTLLFASTCRLLSSLCALFGTRSLCFQSLAASFCKTPGWGASRCGLWTLGGSQRDSRCRRCSYGHPAGGYRLLQFSGETALPRGV